MSDSVSAMAVSPVREIAATFGKAAVALGVFGGMMLGWQQIQARNADTFYNSLPLPNLVQQDGCAIWVVGSSSMSKWESLRQDLRPWSAHNRAISGASVAELTMRFSNERHPQPPKAIVYYAGENDLAFGVPVDVALGQFKIFMTRKREQMGAVPVFFVSIKPSPTRWTERPLQRALNAAVRTMASERADLYFIDTVPQFLKGGRLGDNYVEDGLHLNGNGYAILTDAIRGTLESRMPAPLVDHCTRTDASVLR